MNREVPVCQFLLSALSKVSGCESAQMNARGGTEAATLSERAYRKPENAMTPDPLVSIVLPVYNGGAHLRASIESLLRQSFADFELIIVNDGSTDDSLAVVNRFAAADRRIRVINQTNEGLVSALNHGVGAANSSYIARMDADDVSMARRIEKQIQVLKDNPKIGVLGSQVSYCGEMMEELFVSDYPTDDAAIRKELRFSCPLAHPVTMFRTRVFEKAGGYRSQFDCCEDLDLWLRIAEQDVLFCNLSDVLLKYRVNPEGVSIRKKDRQRRCSSYARSVALERASSSYDPASRIGGFEEIERSQFSESVLPVFDTLCWLDSLFTIAGESGKTLEVLSLLLRKPRLRQFDRAHVSGEFLEITRKCVKESAFFHSIIFSVAAFIVCPRTFLISLRKRLKFLTVIL